MFEPNSFKKLLGGTVNRLLIVVWPPFCEEKMLDVDIAVGLELVGHEGQIFQLNISKEDCWTPMVSLIKESNIFEWRLFKPRLEEWMGGLRDDQMAYELYDATNASSFKNIVQQDILGIEFLTLSSEFRPFGVKIIFERDFIILSPGSDGSTVETSTFNRLDNLANYSTVGDVELVRLEVAEQLAEGTR